MGMLNVFRAAPSAPARQNPAYAPPRIVKRGSTSEAVRIIKGSVIQLSDHLPTPPVADPNSTDFGEVLRSMMGKAPSLMPLGKASVEKVKVQKSGDRIEDRIEARKEFRTPASVLRDMKRGKDVAISEITESLIKVVTEQAIEATLERVNNALGGIAELKKAEQPTHAERVAHGRAELAQIDLDIASGKSGMLDLLLAEPMQVTKADQDIDTARYRRDFGIQSDNRILAHKDAR